METYCVSCKKYTANKNLSVKKKKKKKIVARKDRLSLKEPRTP